jgi:hypothetical protein
MQYESLIQELSFWSAAVSREKFAVLVGRSRFLADKTGLE